MFGCFIAAVFKQNENRKIEIRTKDFSRVQNSVDCWTAVSKSNFHGWWNEGGLRMYQLKINGYKTNENVVIIDEKATVEVVDSLLC